MEWTEYARWQGKCFVQVDMTTKVFHTMAHAVRLCSVHSEECMFYGKSDVQEDVFLENFEVTLLITYKSETLQITYTTQIEIWVLSPLPTFVHMI